MNKLIAINVISTQMNISSRALRHWEDMGLFKSTRDLQSGWRMYDEDAVVCIHMTDLLRRIDLSIEDIKKILEHKSIDELLIVLKRQLRRLEKTTKDVDKRYAVISEIIESIQNKQVVSLPEIENILPPVSIRRSKKTIKTNIEEIDYMSIFNLKYEHEFTITSLPPMRTAACHHYGLEPEDPDPALTWIKDNNLLGTARFFGFYTNPSATDTGPGHSYDFCVSIPEDTVIPDYLYEMDLPGGLYAAFTNQGMEIDELWDKICNGFNNPACEWERDNDRHESPRLELHEGGVFGAVECPLLVVTILVPIKKKA